MVAAERATPTDDVRQTTVVTPSGIEVQYESAPRRLYRLRHEPGKGERKSRAAFVVSRDGEWAEVPSVTTVLEVLDKPALPWWGMKIGIEGTLALISLGHLGVGRIGPRVVATLRAGDQGLAAAGVDHVVEMLTAHKLTVNHVRDKAGVRGVGVHDALEAWARDGSRPDPAIFPPEEEGYVRGLLAFLDDVPSAVALSCEVMVGSVKYGFAGRYDVRIKTTEPHRVVIHRTPVRGPQYAELKPGVYLGDLKTSKSVYASHSRQLEAYEAASIECGYDPTDGRGVLHVNPDGTYEFVRSTATFHDFKVVLDVWRSDQAMKGRKR